MSDTPIDATTWALALASAEELTKDNERLKAELAEAREELAEVKAERDELQDNSDCLGRVSEILQGDKMAGIEAVALTLKERLAANEAELAALKKDAERYRWLRECNTFRSDRVIYVRRGLYEDGLFLGNEVIFGTALDEAIDAALDAGKSQPKEN